MGGTPEMARYVEGVTRTIEEEILQGWGGGGGCADAAKEEPDVDLVGWNIYHVFICREAEAN
jgi:hypothetical protein